MKSRYFEIGGGIGDALNDIYRYGGYAQLQAMRPPDEAVVTCVSHNPHIVELFQHWPEGPKLTVRYFPWWDDWNRERRKNRLPNPPMKTIRKNGVVNFHSHPSDVEGLVQLPLEYVLFSVSAGQLFRNIPDEIVAALMFKSPYRGVFVGREYKRNGYGNHKREEKIWCGSNATCLINQLSIPATVNAIRDPRCKGVVTAHSALSIVAGHERKPMLLLYPEEVRIAHFRKKDQWSWYQDDPQVFHGTFDQWKPLAEKFFNHIK